MAGRNVMEIPGPPRLRPLQQPPSNQTVPVPSIQFVESSSPEVEDPVPSIKGSVCLTQLLSPKCAKSWQELHSQAAVAVSSPAVRSKALGIQRKLEKYSQRSLSQGNSAHKYGAGASTRPRPENFIEIVRRIAEIFNCGFSKRDLNTAQGATQVNAHDRSLDLHQSASLELQIRADVFYMQIVFNTHTMIVEKVACQLPGGSSAMPKLARYFNEIMIPQCASRLATQTCLDHAMYYAKLKNNYCSRENSKLYQTADKFLFNFHLIHLNEFMFISNDTTKCKEACLSLIASVERDLMLLAKLDRGHASFEDIVNKSKIGICTKRYAGRPLKLDFFISPHDALTRRSASPEYPKTAPTDSLELPTDLLSATLHIVPYRQSQQMPTKQLYQSNGIEMDLTESNSQDIPACFEIRLNQMAVLTDVECKRIIELTGVDQYVVYSGQFFSMISQAYESQNRKNEARLYHPSPTKTQRVKVHGRLQIWHIHNTYNHNGNLMSSVRFTRVRDLVEIISILRHSMIRQNLLLSLLFTPKKKVDKNEVGSIFHFWFKSANCYEITSSTNFSFNVGLANGKVKASFSWIYNKLTCNDEAHGMMADVLQKGLEKILSIPAYIQLALTKEFIIFKRSNMRELDTSKVIPKQPDLPKNAFKGRVMVLAANRGKGGHDIAKIKEQGNGNDMLKTESDSYMNFMQENGTISSGVPSDDDRFILGSGQTPELNSQSRCLLTSLLLSKVPTNVSRTLPSSFFVIEARDLDKIHQKGTFSLDIRGRGKSANERLGSSSKGGVHDLLSKLENVLQSPKLIRPKAISPLLNGKDEMGQPPEKTARSLSLASLKSDTPVTEENKMVDSGLASHHVTPNVAPEKPANATTQNVPPISVAQPPVQMGMHAVHGVPRFPGGYGNAYPPVYQAGYGAGYQHGFQRPPFGNRPGWVGPQQGPPPLVRGPTMQSINASLQNDAGRQQNEQNMGGIHKQGPNMSQPGSVPERPASANSRQESLDQNPSSNSNLAPIPTPPPPEPKEGPGNIMPKLKIKLGKASTGGGYQVINSDGSTSSTGTGNGTGTKKKRGKSRSNDSDDKPPKAGGKKRKKTVEKNAPTPPPVTAVTPTGTQQNMQGGHQMPQMQGGQTMAQGMSQNQNVGQNVPQGQRMGSIAGQHGHMQRAPQPFSGQPGGHGQHIQNQPQLMNQGAQQFRGGNGQPQQIQHNNLPKSIPQSGMMVQGNQQPGMPQGNMPPTSIQQGSMMQYGQQGNQHQQMMYGGNQQPQQQQGYGIQQPQQDGSYYNQNKPPDNSQYQQMHGQQHSNMNPHMMRQNQIHHMQMGNRQGQAGIGGPPKLTPRPGDMQQNRMYNQNYYEGDKDHMETGQ